MCLLSGFTNSAHPAFLISPWLMINLNIYHYLEHWRLDAQQ